MKITPLLFLFLITFSQAYGYDLPTQATKPYNCEECDLLSHELLQDTWAIDSESLFSPVTNAQQSVRYKQTVTMKQLRQGVTIYTQSAKAVIRIDPGENTAVPELEIIGPNYTILPLVQASTTQVQNGSLGESSHALRHQTIWQLKPELQHGAFTIYSKDKKVKETALFTIHVYDKFSTTVLEVETDKLHYQLGDTVTATISLKNNDTTYPIQGIDVSLVNPEGKFKALDLVEIDQNRVQAQFIMDSTSNDYGRVWYIEADVYSNYGPSTVKRNGHTAFSYSIPSASLLTVTKVSLTPLVVESKVEVATASRYSIQAALFLKSERGGFIPLEISHTSQWLEPGIHTMHFGFDNVHHLDEDRLYLGYLRLIDYGQLTPVYQYLQPIEFIKLTEQ